MSTDHDVTVSTDTEKQTLGSFVSRQIAVYGSDRPALAALRSGVGRPFRSASPMLLLYTQAPGWSARDDSRKIEAAHSALTLFALRSTGSSGGTAHRKGISFGRALRAVAVARNSDSATDRSIRELTTAGTYAEVSSHLRRAVSLMAQANVSLDFVSLAFDLDNISRGGDRKRKVLIAWASDYLYKATNKEGSK